jgi:hypothetical protein
MAARLRSFWNSAYAVTLFASVFAGAALAQQPSANDIANSLAPKTSLTRGLTLSNPNAEQEQRVLDGLKNRRTRSITVEERNQVAAIAEKKA